MHVFKHPKYYEEFRKRAKRYQKELREAGNELAKRNAVKEDLACSGSSSARNKSDQAISLRAHDGECERAPDPGLKLPGPRPISNANKGLIHTRQDSSAKLVKHQAASIKPQA